MANETLHPISTELHGEDAHKFVLDTHISVNDLLPPVRGSLAVVGAEIQRVFDPNTDIFRAIDLGFRS